MNNPRHRLPGFTLLEMMLVLVVISVMVSLLAVNLSDSPLQKLEREAKRLQMVIDFVAEEAVMQGAEFSFVLSAQQDNNSNTVEGYQFLLLNTEDLSWQVINTPSFKFHSLPPDISIDVRPDDGASDSLLLERQAELIRRSTGQLRFQPLLLLLSSGEITPFKIVMRHSQADQFITLSSDGISGVERQ